MIFVRIKKIREGGRNHHETVTCDLVSLVLLKSMTK